MNENLKYILDECLKCEYPFCTHAFIVVKPFYDTAKIFAQKKGMIFPRSPTQLKDLGYIPIANTLFAYGRPEYKIRWGKSLSTVYVRPYIYTLWKEYTVINKSGTFPGLIRYIIRRYDNENIPYSQPLFPNWESANKIPAAPHLDQDDLTQTILDLIENDDYIYATQDYICQAPLVKDISNRLNCRVSYSIIRDIVLDLGYVNVKEIPGIETDGMIPLPPKFNTPNKRYRTPVFVVPRPQVIQHIESTGSVTEFLNEAA
jgi:hypothetical protein